MTYLVTGGTGYIGSYIVRDLLKAGKQVVCFQRSGVTDVARETLGEEGIAKIKIAQGDVSDPLQLFDVIRKNDVEVVVHTSYSIPPACEDNPAMGLKVNCGGMNNVLEAARMFKLRKVVWTSSTNALGRAFVFYKDPIGDDSAIYKPVTMYGATKVLNEFMSRLYFAKFGVDSIGIRLPRVYGVGRWHGVAGEHLRFYQKCALNQPVTIEDYDFSTAYLYIDDAAAIIAKACDVPTTKTRVFNVAEGQYTNRQLTEGIRKINPQTKLKLVKPEGPIKGYVLPVVDSSGAKSELKWRAQYSLADGLKQIFNYFRAKEGMPLL